MTLPQLQVLSTWTHTHTHTPTLLDSLPMPLDMGFMAISAPPQEPITHWGPLLSPLSTASWCVSSFQLPQRKRCRSPTVSLVDQIHSCYSLSSSGGFAHRLLCCVHWNLRAADGANTDWLQTLPDLSCHQLAGFTQVPLENEKPQITNTISGVL